MRMCWLFNEWVKQLKHVNDKFSFTKENDYIKNISKVGIKKQWKFPQTAIF